MIFQPGTLKDLPATHLTSFYLAPGHDQQIVDLSRAFPAVTILQVEALLELLRSILAQVTLAVEYVLLFVLAAGMAVLFSGLQATLDERIRQGALLRALGAERKLLVKARRIEFGLLGAVSGLLAALGTELVTWVLYRYAFDLAWHPHPWLLLLPVIGALLIGAAGVFGTRRAECQPADRIARRLKPGWHVPSQGTSHQAGFTYSILVIHQHTSPPGSVRLLRHPPPCAAEPVPWVSRWRCNPYGRRSRHNRRCENTWSRPVRFRFRPMRRKYLPSCSGMYSTTRMSSRRLRR